MVAPFFVSRGVPLAITLQRAGLSGVTGTGHENPVGGLDVQAMKLVKFGLSFHLATPVSTSVLVTRQTLWLAAQVMHHWGFNAQIPTRARWRHRGGEFAVSLRVLPDCVPRMAMEPPVGRRAMARR